MPRKVPRCRTADLAPDLHQPRHVVCPFTPQQALPIYVCKRTLSRQREIPHDLRPRQMEFLTIDQLCAMARLGVS